MQYHGLRKSVAEEYIEVLKDLGKVNFDKGDIIWNGKTSNSTTRIQEPRAHKLKEANKWVKKGES